MPVVGCKAVLVTMNPWKKHEFWLFVESYFCEVFWASCDDKLHCASPIHTTGDALLARTDTVGLDLFLIFHKVVCGGQFI